MSNPWVEYRQVVVETYYAVKPGKTSRIHVRPIEEQPYPVDWDVECSRSMRQLYPIGTTLRIYAKETNKDGGNLFSTRSIRGRLKSSSDV